MTHTIYVGIPYLKSHTGMLGKFYCLRKLVSQDLLAKDPKSPEVRNQELNVRKIFLPLKME